MEIEPVATSDESLLEKKPTEQKKSVGGFRGLFRNRCAELSQNNATKPDHQMPNKPAIALKKGGAGLQKGGACEILPIKLDMEHLPAFLAINTESTVRPDITLAYHSDDNKENINYFKALYDFFCYWDSSVDFEKNFSKKKKNALVDFCREKMDLFEKFFPLPEKYRLFVEELAKIICKKNMNTKYSANDFSAKYRTFQLILKAARSYNKRPAYNNKYVGVFEGKPDDFLSFLRTPCYDFLSDGVMTKIKYFSFEKKLKKFLENIKNKNIPEDPQDMENKIKALTESNLNKNSISGEKSFFDAMKDEMRKYGHLTKHHIGNIKNVWRKIRRGIIGKGLSVKTLKISVNGNVVPEQCIPAVEDFLGFIVKESEDLFLGKWDSAKLPQDSKIRQGLVAAALTNLVICHSYPNKRDVLGQKKFDSFNNLEHSFSQLTEQERMAVMCTEVKCREKSFPLLPLLFLDCRNQSDWALFRVIQNFAPRVCDVKFQIKGEEGECDIIELLEKIDAFCNKPRDKNTTEEENIKYESFDELNRLVGGLKSTKKKLNEQRDQENKAQEPQRSKEKPSTLMHGAEKEKLEHSPERVVAL